MDASVLLVLLFICSLTSVRGRGGIKGTLSDEWMLKTRTGRSISKDFAAQYGFDIVAEPYTGYYILRAIDPNSKTRGVPVVNMKNEIAVEKLVQLQYLNRTTRGVRQPRPKVDMKITDSNWTDMWHAREDVFPSMGVYEAWMNGFTGAGIHVSVLDDGVEATHTDLLPNYDAGHSYDYLEDQLYVNHTEGDYHGTWCAGIVAAVKNNVCVLGMAYNSRFSAVKIFDSFWGLTDFGESLALTHALAATDIYSNSWGPSDSGEVMVGPGELAAEALRKGTTEGRNGKGAIYTWAAGNGGGGDDCNCDGYANSIYTIATTSVSIDQAPSWYSEECTNILVGTYSGDSPNPGIATTDTGGGCIDYFQGTSASCPMAAGIVALVLEAKPELTWRDIQYLIVETAQKEGLLGANWHTNGAGKQVSHAFGFGLMNADAMIKKAMTWEPLPMMQECEGETVIEDRTSDNGVYIVSTYVSDGCLGTVSYLEHVNVWMSFSSTDRGSLTITLVSPSGTRSRILRRRAFDYYNASTEWTFNTVHSWGENPMGVWTLQIEASSSYTVYTLNAWKLVLYGTRSLPVTAGGTGAQVTEDDDDNLTTYAAVGGVVGGIVVVTIVAAVAYFCLKKPKDPTVFPVTNGPANVRASYVGAS